MHSDFKLIIISQVNKPKLANMQITRLNQSTDKEGLKFKTKTLSILQFTYLVLKNAHRFLLEVTDLN